MQKNEYNFQSLLNFIIFSVSLSTINCQGFNKNMQNEKIVSKVDNLLETVLDCDTKEDSIISITWNEKFKLIDLIKDYDNNYEKIGIIIKRKNSLKRLYSNLNFKRIFEDAYLIKDIIKLIKNYFGKKLEYLTIINELKDEDNKIKYLTHIQDILNKEINDNIKKLDIKGIKELYPIFNKGHLLLLNSNILHCIEFKNRKSIELIDSLNITDYYIKSYEEHMYLFACRKNNIDFVKHLIEKRNINPNLSYDNYRIPIVLAIDIGHCELLKLLINKTDLVLENNKNYGANVSSKTTRNVATSSTKIYLKLRMRKLLNYLFPMVYILCKRL